MKKLLTHLLLFVGFIGMAQTYTMPTTGSVNYTVGSGTFTDSGGPAGNYTNNENGTITFCPATAGTKVQIVFQSLVTESADVNTCYDNFEIYQGSTPTTIADNICGTYTNLTIVSTSADGCITIRFTSNDTNTLAGWIGTISNVTTSCNPPTANYTVSKDKICHVSAVSNTEGDVTFNASGSTTPTGTITRYIWNFGDGTSATTTTPTIVHNYTEPGIYNTSLVVVNSLNCSSTMPSLKKIVVTRSPLINIPDSFDVTCNQSFNLNATATSQTIISSPPRITAGITNLPDGSGVTYESTLDFSRMFPAGTTMVEGCFPSVSLELEHSYTGDLTMYLIAPNGAIVQLFNQYGGSNHFGTCSTAAANGVPGCPLTYTFVNSGGVPIQNALTSNATQTCGIYAGPCESATYYLSQTINSFNNFNALIGTPLAGVWRIRIVDNIALDDGFLFSWTLNFPQSCYGNVEQKTPTVTNLVWSGPNIVSQTTTNQVANNPGPGCPEGLNCVGNTLTNVASVRGTNNLGTYTYTVTATDEYGCEYQKQVTVNVQGPSITRFEYPKIDICRLDPAQTPILEGTGNLAGTYTSVPSGLSINANTGQINPGSSTVGNYTVTFTTECGAIRRSTNVSIIQEVTPTFTQVASICEGGTFTLPTTSNNGIVGVWTPALNNLATTTYTFTPNTQQCARTVTMTVLVKPKPVATATPNTQTICSGNATNIVLTSNRTGTTFAWTATQTGVTGATSGTGASIAQVLTATGSAPGSVTYTIIPTANGCAGNPINVTIEVVPKPSLNFSPNTLAICSGTNATINLSSPTAGVTFSWTVEQDGVTGASAGTGSTISQILTSNRITGGTVNYIVTPSYNGCVGDPRIYTVSVYPEVQAIATPITQSFCSGGVTSINLSSPIEGTTFTWTVVQNGVVGATNGNGNSITQTLTTTGNTNGTAVYTIVPSVNGCTGTPTVVTISVNKKPEVFASVSENTICSGTSTAINLTSDSAGTTFNWVAQQEGVSGAINGTGNTIVQTLNTIGSLPGTVTYTITPILNGCEGNPISVSIIVNPKPTAVATPTSQTICSGTSTNIALTSGTSGTTYSWTVVQNGVSGATAGSGNSITQTLEATTANSGTAIYTIIPTANGCVGEPVTVTITVNAIPTVVATPVSQTLCSGSTTNIALSSTTTGTTYIWTVVQNGVSGALAGSGNTISQNLTATGANSGTVTYTIIPTANGCVGEPITVIITVDAKPVVVATPSSQILCSGTTTNIALSSNTPGTTYSWTVAQNGVSGAVAGSGNLISQMLSATGSNPGTVTYTIIPTANGCIGEPITVEVTVNPIPVVIATPLNQTLCSGSSTNIVLSSATSETTYSWTVVQNGVAGAVAGNGDTISQSLTTTGPNSGTVTYSITPTANGCVGQPITVTITVNPIPQVVATPSTQTLCSGSATNIELSSLTTGTTYNWTVVQDGVIGAIAGNGENIVQTLTATGPNSGTVTYTITPIANGCVGEPINVTIIVNAIPIATATPTSQTVCSGSTTNIVLSSESTDTTFTWTVVQNGVTGAIDGSGELIAQNLFASGPNAGTAIYTITPVANGCTGEPITVTITVNAIPEVVATPTSQSLCSGSSTDIVLSSLTSGTTYNWTVVQNGVSGAVAGTGNTISQNLTASGPSTGTVVYSITPIANGCIGETIDVRIEIKPRPTINIFAEALNLCSGTTTNITFESNTVGVNYTWTASSNGVTGASSGSGNSITDTLTTMQSGTVTYTIIPEFEGCIGESKTVTINVNSFIVPQFEQVDAVCEGESLADLPTVSLNGIQGTWSPAINNRETTTYYFTPTITNSGSTCNTTTSMTIVVFPKPVAVLSNTTDVICTGQTIDFNFQSSVPNTTFIYNVVSTNVEGAAGGQGNTVSHTLINNSTNAGSIVYAITPFANNCQGETIYKELIVNPIPVMNYTVSDTTICTGESVSASFTSSIPGTTYSWQIISNNVTGATQGTGTTFTHSLTTLNPNGGTVKYIVTPSFNGCKGDYIEFEIFVKPRPEVFGPSQLTICSGQNAFIELSASHPDVTYEYTVNSNNVMGAFSGTGNIIDQMLETLNESIGTVTYTITPYLNGCSGSPINVIVRVNPLKYIELPDGYICYDLRTGEATTTYTINSGLNTTQFNIVWLKDGEIIQGQSGASLVVNQSGNYQIQAINTTTGCEAISDIAVISESFVAESVSAHVSNNLDSGTITVVVQGTGNYLYQLDNGNFQEENVFTNVLPGNHTVTIKDLEGCTYEVLEVKVISFPNFFTPNGDGINDTWNIWSLSDQQDAEIFIMDRYGKLLRQISPAGSGWDGTYNGTEVPSTDYWFVVKYRDGIQQEFKEFKSHFSLKR